MEMTIELERLRTYAYHGVMPQERRVGNFFETTVKLTYHPAEDDIADDIAGTINYAEIAEIVTREMAIPSQLLEHVAGRIRTAILRRFPCIATGMVRVSKPTPPLGLPLTSASATITW